MRASITSSTPSLSAVPVALEAGIGRTGGDDLARRACHRTAASGPSPSRCCWSSVRRCTPDAAASETAASRSGSASVRTLSSTVAVPDGRDRSPEVERVLGLPARDAGIGRREVDQSQGASGRRQVQPVRLYHLARDAVPDRRRRGQPEPCDLGLLVRPRHAGQRPDLLHLVVVARIAPAVTAAADHRAGMARGSARPTA